MQRTEEKTMTPQCQSLLHLPPLFPLICNTIKFTSHYSATSNSDKLIKAIQASTTLSTTMLGNMKVSGTRAKEPKRLTKSPMKGSSAATKTLKPRTRPRAQRRRVRL